MANAATFIAPSGSFAATGGRDITASDTAFIEPVTRGIAFSGAGALAVEYVDGQTHTIASGVLSAGIIHPIQVRRILATGTSATGITAFF